MEIFHNGNFWDNEIEGAPYTHVILDYVLEVAAIAKKTKINATTNGIAKQLVKLLNKTEFAATNNIRFDISDISDPSDFITYLKESVNISKFWFTFTRPNSFDINEDFIKPLQGALQEVNGKKGTATLQGESLESYPLEEITRSAAATGDDAGALIQRNEGEKYERKYLRKHTAAFQYQDIVEKNDKLTILDIIRRKYNDIRKG